MISCQQENENENPFHKNIFVKVRFAQKESLREKQKNPPEKSEGPLRFHEAEEFIFEVLFVWLNYFFRQILLPDTCRCS